MLPLVIVLLIVNIILMLIFYRRISRNFSQNAYRDKMREEVNRLIIDIEHQSDNAVTVLEDKMQRIEKLLADTDKHLLLIEKSHEKWVYQKDVMQAMQPPPEKKSIQNSLFPAEAIDAPSPKGDSITIYTKQLAGQADIVKSGLGLSPREQVIDFAKKGFSLDFIAEKVDLPLGEIELILSLNT